MLKLPNGAYDILKWVALLLLPALAFFMNDVGDVLGITDVEGTVRVVNAVALLLGTILGVSTNQFNKEDKHE